MFDELSKEYNPSEPRDDKGQWSGGGGSAQTALDRWHKSGRRNAEIMHGTGHPKIAAHEKKLKEAAAKERARSDRASTKGLDNQGLEKMNVFAQITKVDEAARSVYGRAVQEVPDKSDEIFDYESSKPYFKAWSDECAKDTDGKSLGNVRAMHGNVCAGVLKGIDFNDDDKAIDVCAKVIDDNEWEKVLAGAYRGFSIGGSYVDGSRKAEKLETGKTLTRYTANPSEISLVDSPCIPTAKFFDIKKADGSTLQKAFVEQPTPEDAVDELAKLLNAGSISPEALLKAARDSLVKAPYIMPNKVEPKAEEVVEDVKPVEVVADVPAADPVEDADVAKAVVTTPTQSADVNDPRCATKADEHLTIATFPISFAKGAVTDIKTVYTTDAATGAAIIGKMTADERIDALETRIADACDSALKVLEGDSTDAPVRKYGLDSVSTLAQVLECITTIAMMADDESSFEGDNSPIPAALRAWVAEGARIFQDMSIEESNELVATLNTDKDEALVEMAARVSMAKRVQDPDIKAAELVAFAKRYLPAAEFVKTPADELADALKKYGARHSATDLDRLQKAHDHLADMGAACRAEPAAANTVGPEVLTSVKSDAGTLLKASLEAGELRAELAKRDTAIDELTKRLKAVEDQPLPIKGQLRAVNKNEDGAEPAPLATVVLKTPPGQHDEKQALELMKLSLRNPGAPRFMHGLPMN